MRNKEFYDAVNHWDRQLQHSTQTPEYLQAIANDKPKAFFDEYYSVLAEYDLITYYYKGVPKSEISECIAFIHNIPYGSAIRAGITRRVSDEIRAIKQAAWEEAVQKAIDEGAGDYE